MEYFFEPPLFVPLMLAEQCRNEEYIKFVLESYLYDELFLGALAGRSINTNRSDDSSIYRVKPEIEVDGRISHSWSRKELDCLAKSGVVAFKVPSAPSLMTKFKDWYSGARLIYVHRKPSEVINSLLQKNWLASRQASDSVIWPWKVIGEMSVPWWVSDESASDYFNLNEIDRCAYYYLKVVQDAESDDRFYWVNYHELIDTPDKVTAAVCDWLQAEPGAKSKELISYVKRSVKNRDARILEKVSSRFQEIVNYE